MFNWNTDYKKVRWFIMIAAMLFLLTGRGTSSAYDGSRVSDASGFRMECSILNREESADLSLTKGDRLRISPSHTNGFGQI